MHASRCYQDEIATAEMHMLVNLVEADEGEVILNSELSNVP